MPTLPAGTSPPRPSRAAQDTGQKFPASPLRRSVSASRWSPPGSLSHTGFFLFLKTPRLFPPQVTVKPLLDLCISLASRSSHGCIFGDQVSAQTAMSSETSLTTQSSFLPPSHHPQLPHPVLLLCKVFLQPEGIVLDHLFTCPWLVSLT